MKSFVKMPFNSEMNPFKSKTRKKLDDLQRKIEEMEAFMKTATVSGSSSVTTAVHPPPPSPQTAVNPPPPPPPQTAVNPPPGASNLLQFVGTCGGKGTALFIGTPPGPPMGIALSPQPTCIVVGYKETTVWKEGEEVTVTINGQTVRGEVVSLAKPWVAAVELFEPLKLPEVPVRLGRLPNKEVVFVRPGVELPAIINEKSYQAHEPAGIVPGVQMGDLIVKWDSAGVHRLDGIVIKTDKDGNVFGYPFFSGTLFCLEVNKKQWYRTKYPGRQLDSMPTYG